jgi:hypothetical protein
VKAGSTLLVLFLALLRASLLVASQDAAAEDNPLVLRLEATQNATTLDDPVECRLVISGAEVSSITASLPDGIAQHRAPYPNHPAFVYAFDFKPSKVGTTTLGPFRLVFQGRELVSNSLEIRVLPAPENPNALRLFASSSSIRLGDSFDLTIVQHGKVSGRIPNPKLKGAKLAGARSFVVQGTEESKTVVVYRVTPTVAGTVVVNAASFGELPQGVTVPELRVEVLPP